jgi:predicted alpha/beta superfamily hydrolase
VPRASEEGRLRYHPRFPSSFLSTRRNIVVYVPPGYGEANARYPVLYLHDGQNLFDPATAFGGQDWRVDIAADNMIRKGEIPPLIIVGIYNTGARRLSEYTPTRDRKLRKGGKAARHAQMLARELKPFIDREYRTLKPAMHTAVGGSSLGALVSLVTGLDYPRVFGKLALLSPSVWWDNCAILQNVYEYRGRSRPRIWLDTGTAEGDNPRKVVEDARALRDALIAKGWSGELDLIYTEFENEPHSEPAWSARFGAVLLYLYG